MNAERRSLLLGVLAIAATLPVGWALVLPEYLLFDALAYEAAAVGGAISGSVAFLSAAVVTWWRVREEVRARLAFQTARELALLSTAAPVSQWYLDRADARMPYIESFSLLAMQVAVGLAASLAAYVWVRRCARRHGALPSPRLPGVRTIFTASAAILGLFTAVVLGVGSSARAAGAVDRQQGDQLDHLAELLAGALTVARDDVERRRLLDLLSHEPHLGFDLLPPNQRPTWTLAATRMATRGERTVLLLEGGRLHVARRMAGERVLWLSTWGNVRPPVRAPDDAPAMLILAMLVLGAPLAAFLVGHDLREQLADITRALDALGPAAGDPDPATVGVPVASYDEVGDLASELNATCSRFAEEQRRLADDLFAAAAGDRARNRLLATASHELRTPLTSIIGYCHLLRRRGVLTPAQREDIEMVSSASDQLLRHVDDILDLSRIESGREFTLEVESVDLVALAREVLGARRTRLTPGVTADVDTMPDVPPARADPRRIRQVLENLVDNAIKFTSAGFVLVSVGPGALGDRPAVHVQVADSGPGIPEDQLQAVFTEFHRVDQQRDVAGTGLGLAIAGRLVERHGGKLWATSVLGEGSVFHLVLPAAAE